MKIYYSKEIDKKIHEEVNTKGKKLSRLFGYDFPKVILDKEKAAIARQLANDKNNQIDKKRAAQIMSEIYKKKLPQLTLYINTTPFSTWNTKNKYISISIDRFPTKIFSSFCHELNHFIYDLVYKTRKYEDTEIKETITILNEVFGIKDNGWKIFEKQRNKVLEYFQKTKDFTKTIEYTQNLFREL